MRNELDEVEEATKQILDLEGKFILFKISGYSCVNDSARDWYIGSLCDDPATIVEYAQGDKSSSQESDDDGNLDLLLGNTTQGDSNALGDNGLNGDNATVVTPSLKWCREEDDDTGGPASNTQNSTNLKLKHVKVEKP